MYDSEKITPPMAEHFPFAKGSFLNSNLSYSNTNNKMKHFIILVILVLVAHLTFGFYEYQGYDEYLMDEDLDSDYETLRLPGWPEQSLVGLTTACSWQYGGITPAVCSGSDCNSNPWIWKCAIPSDGPTKTYSLNMVNFCKAHHGPKSDAWIRGSGIYAWLCKKDNGDEVKLTNNDFVQACHDQYGPTASAKYSNSNNAKSWYCETSAKLNDIDVTGYCRYIGYDVAQVSARKDEYGLNYDYYVWYCK